MVLVISLHRHREFYEEACFLLFWPHGTWRASFVLVVLNQMLSNLIFSFVLQVGQSHSLSFGLSEIAIVL